MRCLWELRQQHNRRNQAQLSHPYIPVKELRQAENLILKLIQHEVLNEEIKILLCCATGGDDMSRKVTKQRNRSTKQTSSLYRFDQIIDNYGILRVGGRIKRVNIPYPLKYPDILLTKSQSLSWLLDTIIIEMSTRVLKLWSNNYCGSSVVGNYMY